MLLAEFGFVLNVIGVWLGWRDLQRKGRTTAGLLVLVGCVLMALLLVLQGLAIAIRSGLALRRPDAGVNG